MRHRPHRADRRRLSTAAVVRDDDVSGFGRGDTGIQRPDDRHSGDAADDLGGDPRADRRGQETAAGELGH